MEKTRKQIIFGLISFWAAIIILFVVLTGFGTVPRKGEISLQFLKPIDSESVTFTKWRFVNYDLPNGELDKLRFSALIKPEYFEMRSGNRNENVVDLLTQLYGEKVMIQVFDAERIRDHQYRANAVIQAAGRITQGQFYYKPSSSDYYSFEGEFETDDNWINPELSKMKYKFSFSAYIPD